MSGQTHQNTTEVPTFKATSLWILYAVPSAAFVFGLVLFTLICKTQQSREKVRRAPAIKTYTNRSSVRHTDTQCTGNSHVTQVEKENNLAKQEAQSYENVVAAIYNNDDKVTYFVSPDEDYITPDTVGEEGAAQDHNIYLQPNQHLSDTDGESYENMESCLYAQPRKSAHAHTLNTEDDDYIDPDTKQNLEQTDTESYENMAGSVCPVAAHNSTDTIDDESYVHMYSFNPPSAYMEMKNRGASERREGQCSPRQKTV